jgi:predicted enzyme related to lactoylglutathione lyase
MLGVVLDCENPGKLAEFWCGALQYRSLGQHEQYAILVPEEGGRGPQFFLQQVEEPKAGKNRMHVDVHASDIEAEATRLESLGATRLREKQESAGSAWIVMSDPEGNEFCVCTGPDLGV